MPMARLDQGPNTHEATEKTRDYDIGGWPLEAHERSFYVILPIYITRLDAYEVRRG
jgi:hypothetical protein